MKCHYHPGVDAVDKCTMCGKEICSDCKLDYDGKIVCKPCAMPLVNFFAPMIGGACSHSTEPILPFNLLERLQKTVQGRIADANLDPREDEIRKFILKYIARTGKSPSYDDIGNDLEIFSANDVKLAVNKLHDADILSEKNGRMISAYPFSTIKTNHRIIFYDGHEVYTLCAIDSLGAHFMLGEDITVLSECPECKHEQKIVLKSGQIVSRNPTGIVIFVSSDGDCGRVAETCCPFINFFCSEAHLEQWKRENPKFKNGESYPLNDALEYSKAIFGDLLSPEGNG